MSEVAISIIVPVYNVEKYLDRCINSILEQSFRDYEVILVDDGSKDSSGLRCDKYAMEHDNFYVIHKENAGLGYARNSGLDIAQGKYVMFIDSDDYILPDMLETMYSQLIGHNADTCIGGYCRVTAENLVKTPNPLTGIVFESNNIIDELLVKMTGKLPNGTDYIEMSVWKVLFSNDIIRDNNLRFPSERKLISEDIIFDIEYYTRAKRVYISDNCGYCYCDNEGSLTTSYRPNRFELHKVLLETLSDTLKKKGLDAKCKIRLENNFICNVRHCVRLEVEFRKKNGKNQCIGNIKKICNDDLVKNILLSFPNNEVPLKPRVLNWLIKNKLICMIYMIAR